jgi:hypothetical protein
VFGFVERRPHFHELGENLLVVGVCRV